METACSINQSGRDGVKWGLLFPHILWNLWKGRNDAIFNNKLRTARDILNRSILEAREAQQLLLIRKGPLTAVHRWVVWTPPGDDFIKLNSDGAMKTRSQLASAGGLLRDHHGEWVVGYTCNIGIMNSFMAELWGLWEGLLIAKNRGFTKIIAETDSETMAHVLSKQAEVTDNAITLVKDCKNLLGHFQISKIVHIFREGNQCADFLANLGQTSPWGTIVMDHPPDGLDELLLRDASGIAFSRRS